MPEVLNPTPPSGRRLRIISLATAIVVTVFVFRLRFGEAPVRELAPRDRALPAAAWPTLEPSARGAPEPLAVRGFVERGALRVVVTNPPATARLFVVSADSASRRLLERRPDFAEHDVVEFYGLTAGLRHGYIEGDGLVSGILTFDVKRGRICEVRAGELRRAASRRLELRADGRILESGATILAAFDGFDVLHRWTGRTLDLGAPLDRPARLVVKHDERSNGDIELGTSIAPDDRAERVIVAQDRGTATVALAGPDHAASSAAKVFRLSITPGTDRPEDDRPFEVSNLLACIPEAEFTAPPRIHTWCRADEGLPSPTIRGLRPGRHRIGAGLVRRGRYTLWREHDVATDEAVVVSIAPLVTSTTAGFDDGSVSLLPTWLRSFHPGESGPRLVASRERRLHPRGPAEVWEHVISEGEPTARRIGWRDGSGAVYPERRMADLEPDVPAAEEQFESWTGRRISRALGLDIATLGLTEVGITATADGEPIFLETADPDPIELPKPVTMLRVRSQETTTSLWGLADPAATTQPDGPGGRILILNRTGSRNLHVTLPRAEVRLTLQAGELRELHVTEPGAVFILAVRPSAEDAVLVAEEGVGIELEAKDLLVVEYD